MSEDRQRRSSTRSPATSHAGGPYHPPLPAQYHAHPPPPPETVNGWGRYVAASLALLQHDLASLRAEMAETAERLDHIEARASDWSRTWQDVVKRLPWEKVGVLLMIAIMLSSHVSPDLRDALLKRLLP